MPKMPATSYRVSADGLACKAYALDAEQKYQDRFKKRTGCTMGLQETGFTP
jgi:hypothetical protein